MTITITTKKQSYNKAIDEVLAETHRIFEKVTDIISAELNDEQYKNCVCAFATFAGYNFKYCEYRSFSLAEDIEKNAEDVHALYDLYGLFGMIYGENLSYLNDEIIPEDCLDIFVGAYKSYLRVFREYNLRILAKILDNDGVKEVEDYE